MSPHYINDGLDKIKNQNRLLTWNAGYGAGVHQEEVPARISIKLRFPEIDIKVIYCEVKNTPHISIELT